MRSQVVVPVVCAALGGAVTAGALMATGVVGSGQTVIQQAAPLLTAGPVGGTAAGDVYRRESTGVVGVTAETVPVRASAFDVDDARPGRPTSGSGFVIDDKGHIVTAAHLVRAASDVQVQLGERTLPARVVGLDEGDDIALLRIDPDGLDLHPLELGDSDAIQVGDPVIAIGDTAAGLQPTMAAGTLAARQPRVTSAGGGAVVTDALQTDAPLHATDTGGPLLDGSGRVIGVNTRMLAAGGQAVDLAVPINTARAVLPRLSGAAFKVVGG